MLNGHWGSEERGGGWPFGAGDCKDSSGNTASCDEVEIQRTSSGFEVSIAGVRKPEFDYKDRKDAVVTKISIHPSASQAFCPAPTETSTQEPAEDSSDEDCLAIETPTTRDMPVGASVKVKGPSTVNFYDSAGNHLLHWNPRVNHNVVVRNS